MRSFRGLLFFPLAWAAVYLVLSVTLLGTAAYAPFLRSEIELAKVFATVGGFAAALAHRPGEHLRRAWFLVGSATLFFLIRDLTLAPFGFEAMGETPLLALRAVLVWLGNLAMIAGVYLLARTWRVAGLALPGERRSQLAVLGAAVVLSAVLAGPGVVTYGGRLLTGDLTAASGVASAVGDAVTLILIAPLLLTALALRGGLFVWPWALLVTSNLAWLFYDAVFTFGPMLGLGEGGARVGYELFRALGCTFGFSAGIAQRWIARGHTAAR